MKLKLMNYWKMNLKKKKKNRMKELKENWKSNETILRERDQR